MILPQSGLYEAMGTRQSEHRCQMKDRSPGVRGLSSLLLSKVKPKCGGASFPIRPPTTATTALSLLPLDKRGREFISRIQWPIPAPRRLGSRRILRPEYKSRRFLSQALSGRLPGGRAIITINEEVDGRNVGVRPRAMLARFPLSLFSPSSTD